MKRKRRLSGRPSLIEFMTARKVKKVMFSDLTSEVSFYGLPSSKSKAEERWAGRKLASCIRIRALPKGDEAAMTRDEKSVCDAVETWLKLT